MKKNLFAHHANLFSMLICLTLLAIGAQLLFFVIHYKAGSLFNSLISSSLTRNILRPIIIFPILSFMVISVLGYLVLLGWIWFIATSVGELFKLTRFSTYLLGLLFWLLASFIIVMLNNYFYPHSFFALFDSPSILTWMIPVVILALMTFLAYIHFFKTRQHALIALTILAVCGMFLGASLLKMAGGQSKPTLVMTQQPNIIFIGLDSVRPDFIGYFNSRMTNTPNMDGLLKSATVFTDAYTPLARTFPSWVSILTAKYPKNSNARTNLGDPHFILQNDTIAHRLKAAGYETIYATDEKRFSNITTEYGFDQTIGPGVGINDFILGGLSDFPLTNLMINTALGQRLFPYQFANRAAAITYEPQEFLQLIKEGLSKRSHRPLFLAVHLCISHWPYTWARDQQAKSLSLALRYQSSVAAVDQQFAQLMQILKEAGILQHSIVVLLSDHGTTLGLPGDRIVNEKNYRGNAAQLKWLPRYQLADTDHLVLDTSFGQGTDILSLKQYHVLLALKGFGISLPMKNIMDRVSLLDIGPTILDLLNLPNLQSVDGISLKQILIGRPIANRTFYLETDLTLPGIATDNILIDQVLHHAVGLYQLNPINGLLSIKPPVQKELLLQKQRAVLMDDWLLARYPASWRTKITSTGEFKDYQLPAYFVLANVKTGEWSIVPPSTVTQNALLTQLFEKFNVFYGEETRNN